MTSKELRIGNLIYVDGYLRYVCGTSYKMIQHNFHPQNSVYSENYENECEPIPLTEDWLLKFEFEKENGWDDTTYFNKNGIHIYFWGDYIIGWFEYENEIKIDYIHQLQNIYFSLTNTELNYDKI